MMAEGARIPSTLAKYGLALIHCILAHDPRRESVLTIFAQKRSHWKTQNEQMYVDSVERDLSNDPIDGI